MTYIVGTKHVREALVFRVKSLIACGLYDVAKQVESDMAHILKNEQYYLMPDDATVERMERLKEQRVTQ